MVTYEDEERVEEGKGLRPPRAGQSQGHSDGRLVRNAESFGTESFGTLRNQQKAIKTGRMKQQKQWRSPDFITCPIFLFAT